MCGDRQIGDDKREYGERTGVKREGKTEGGNGKEVMGYRRERTEAGLPMKWRNK